MTKRFKITQNGDLFTVRDTVENESMGVFEFKENEFPVYACFHMIIDLMNDLSDENEQLKKLLECSREEANDYCEELMGKDEFIRLYKRIGDELKEENKQLKQSNNGAIELILDGIVEMHDGKRDYAESIFNKAIRLLKGDVE